MDGEEVVQLYVSGKAGKAPAPLRSLRGFQRIFLKAGENKTLQFTLTQDDFSVLDDNGIPKRFSGKVTLAVGGCQPDFESLKNKKTIQATLNL
jgi:beta-glucosidase